MIKEIYVVTVHDHTHLGGPMGTEYTTEIEHVNCRTLLTAYMVFGELATKHRVPAKAIPSNALPRFDKSYDFGHVGLKITKEPLR
jgi:hypothetical protein